MLDQSTRVAILKLHEQGHGSRTIAAAVGVSRASVRQVIASKSEEVPIVQRPEKAASYRADIVTLLAACKGNLIRVHEELVARGATLSYQALTGFCRRHKLTSAPTPTAGVYTFDAAQEMQHDTSPHRAKIAGRRVSRSNRIAGVVLLAIAVFSMLSNVHSI